MADEEILTPPAEENKTPSTEPDTPTTDDGSNTTPDSTPDGEGSGDSSNEGSPEGGTSSDPAETPTDENENSGNDGGDSNQTDNENGSESADNKEEENPEPPVEEQPTEEEEDDGYHGTQFAAIYNRFLEKITDDMYMELTPEDTIRDLQNLLTDAIPGFEFPRVCLTDYKVKTAIINEADAKPGDFILAVLWQELPEDGEQLIPDVLVERSCFKAELTSEEINILALLMKQGWVQRQVSSIEVTRMKYTGSDFKMTSQANHLSKLLSLLTEAQRESFHMQRLYKRRKTDSNGIYRSEWGTLMQKHVFK